MPKRVTQWSTAIQVVAAILVAKIVLIGLAQWGRWSAISGRPEHAEFAEATILLTAFLSLLVFWTALGFAAKARSERR